MNNNLIKYLEEVRDLLAKPNGWTQLVYARDSAGLEVPPASPDATCFCAYGALDRVYFSTEIANCFPNVRDQAIGILIKKFDSISTWNDRPDQTQENVVSKFNEIINGLKDNEGVAT